MKLGIVAILSALALIPSVARAKTGDVRECFKPTCTVTADGVTATITSSPRPSKYELSVSATGAPAFSVSRPYVSEFLPRPQVKLIDLGVRPDVIVESGTAGGGGTVDLDDFSWSVARDTWLDAQEHVALYYDPGPTLERLGDGFSGFVSNLYLNGFIEFGYRGPALIQRAIGGQFVDVTGRYPGFLRHDAKYWLRVFHKTPEFASNAGELADWAVDESRLGHGVKAAAYIDSQEGHLTLGGQPVSAATVEQLLLQDGFPL